MKSEEKFETGWPFGVKIETKYAKDTGLICPECGKKRMSRHLQHGGRFCWAGCGWLD